MQLVLRPCCEWQESRGLNNLEQLSQIVPSLLTCCLYMGRIESQIYYLCNSGSSGNMFTFKQQPTSESSSYQHGLTGVEQLTHKGSSNSLCPSW